MPEIIDIRYTTETDRGYRHVNLTRCFNKSIERESYMKTIYALIKRNDVIRITIEKYEVDS